MDIQLTEAEEQRILLEARLAKIKRHIDGVKTEIEKLFSEDHLRGRVVSSSDRANAPMEVVLRFDLAFCQPGALKLVADRFAELVTQAQEAMTQEGKVNEELRALSPRVPMKLTIEFE